MTGELIAARLEDGQTFGFFTGGDRDQDRVETRLLQGSERAFSEAAGDGHICDHRATLA
jgi:hypothetical protein